MAYDKIDQLYDALKKDGAVSKSRENFRGKMLAPGKEGYQNRLQLYNALKADGAVSSPTYEEFGRRLGLHAVKAASPLSPLPQPGEGLNGGSPTQGAEAEAVGSMGTGGSRADGRPTLMKPNVAETSDPNGVAAKAQNGRKTSGGMTAAERQRMLTGVGNMMARTDASMRQARNRMDYAKANTGLKVPRVAVGERNTGVRLGQNDKVVATKPQYDAASGEMKQTYITESGNEYDNRAEADLEQNATDEYKDSMTVGGQLREAYAERDRLDEALKKRAKEIDERPGQKFSDFMRELAAGSTAAGPLAVHDTRRAKYEDDDEYMQLMAAARKNHQTIQLLEDKKNDKMNSFWHSLGTTAMNGYTFNDGMSEMRDARALQKATEHMDSINRKRAEGKPLTKEEETAEAVLKNFSTDDAVQGIYGGEYGAWATAGGTAATSLDFMKDITLDPFASGIAKGTARTIAKAAAKGLAKATGKEAADLWKKKAIRLTLKATGILPGAHLAGLHISNTTGIGRTMAAMGTLTSGNVGVDEKGNYKVENAMGLLPAFFEAERQQTRENGSEMFGEFIPGVGGMVKKGLEKIGLSKLSGAMTSIGNKEWYKQYSRLLEAGGYNGLPGEALEEYEGSLFDALTGHAGDAWDDMTSLRHHADIWLGCATMGALLGAVPMMARGYHTAQYYRYKHGTDNADKVASYRLTAERWEPLREKIDNTDNGNMADMVTGIMSDTNLHVEEKKAALNYVRNLTMMRGYNIAQVNNADDNEAAQRPEAQGVNDSYSEGYETTDPEAIVDAWIDLNKKRERVWQALAMESPDEVDERVGGDPIGYIDEMRRSSDTEGMEAVVDYANAKAAYDGMAQRVYDDIDSRVEESNATIDSHVNRADGMTHPASLKEQNADGTDKSVYVVSGNVVMYDDGTGVDTEKSDKEIVVRDAATGEMRMIPATDVHTMGEAIDPEEERAAAQARIAEEMSARVDGVDGVTDMQDGATDVQTGTETEGEATGELVSGTVPTWDAMPGYRVNDTFTLRDGEGATIRGEVQGISDDGVEIRTDAPLNGKYVQVVPAEEFEGMVESISDADGSTVWEASPLSPLPQPGEGVNSGSHTQGKDGMVQDMVQDEAQDEVKHDTAAEEEPEGQPMPMLDNGEEDWQATTPERAHQYIYNEAGLSRSEGNQFVAAKADEAEKALGKAKAAQMPQVGTSIQKYNQAKAKRQHQIDEAQKALDYWNGVRDIQNGIQQEENERRATEDAARRDEAVAQVEEQKRIAAEANSEAGDVDERSEGNPSAATTGNGSIGLRNDERGRTEGGSYQRQGDLAETGDVDDNVVSSSERAEMENRITEWLSEENLERAVGKTRDEIFEEFGNELAPIAYIPAKHLSLLGDNVKDPRIYCGKGYFIDHALRNHGGQGTQIDIDDVDVSKYLNIQYVLDNPDHIKETFTDGKRTVVFIKKIGRYFAELTQVEENGRIVLHKSLFNQKKEPYAKLADIRQKGASSEGGVSSISHADNAAPAISLESRGDAISSEPSTTGSSASKVSESRSDSQENGEKSAENGEETGAIGSGGTMGTGGAMGRETSLAKRKATAFERARKRAERQREARRRKKAEAEKGLDMEPHTPTELAAALLGGGRIKLERSSFLRHTGYGNAEAKKYIGILASRDKGGMSMEEAGEQVLLADEENQWNILDHSDANAGLDALLDALHECRTKGELQKYILSNRIREREGEEEAERVREEAERDDFYYWQYHMSYDDYVVYEEELLPLYIEEESRVPEEARVANLEEMTKIREYYENNGRETGGRGAVREKGFGEQGRDEGGGQGGSDTPYGEMPSSRGSLLEGPSRGEAQGYGEGLSEAWDHGEPPSAREQKAKGAAPVSHNERVLRDALDVRLREGGIDVIGDAEEGQKVLDMANGGDVRLSAKKRRALETVSVSHDEEHLQTAISSADGAKVLNNLDTLVRDYENSSHAKEKTFIGEVADSLGINAQGKSSKYATFETRNGKIVTIRLSNHNAKVSNFDNNGEADGISIVVSPKKNNGVINDGNAHIIEYYYDAIKLRKAEGKPLAEIVKGIRQALYSGEFKDTTGLAEVQEVNADEVARLQKVYHGSGAEFDRFDHSHMGEGEGAQAYGWGTYVSEVEGIGRAYAEKIGTDPLYKEKIAYSNARHGVSQVEEELKAWERLKEKGDFSRFSKESVDSRLDKLQHELAYRRSEEDRLEKELKGKEADPKNRPNRNLYEVEIPDDNGSNYLDWNGKLPKRFLGRVNSALKADGRNAIEQLFPSRVDGKLRGEDLYDTLRSKLGSQEAASKLLSKAGFVGIKYPADNRRGGREDGKKNYVIFNGADAKIVDHVRFFRTANGEAYGFTVGGKIYYDPRIATSETLVHEYAHLWASALRAGNAKEWKNVVGLMKGTSVWEDVKKHYPELKTDDEIADEVLAQYSGKRGAERLREEAKKIADGNGDVFEKAEAISALERVKRALSEFWKGVCDMLHIHYTSAEEVADRVMKDMLDGVDPRKFGKENAAKTFSEKHGVDVSDVETYKNAMKQGNVQSAHWAMGNIRRAMRIKNKGLKLSEFKHVFADVRNEMYERFGNLGELQMEYEERALAERNAMEAARKRAEEEEAKRQKHLEELSLLSDEELDKNYMDALDNGNEVTAREMLDESARRKGYADAESDYQGVGAWAAPSNPGYESDEARRADVGDNAPDVNLEDMALGYSLQPDDYFAHPERYSQNTPHGRESTKAIQNALNALKRGEKDVKVKVYRAVPTSVKEGKLRNGDWVTPSKKYAEMHGNSRLEGKYRIIEDEVPANELWWDANDANEFGYDDGKSYRYKNVKNNRKLNDLVTRDDKGNIIPPSKRFNSRKADIRYQFVGERGAEASDRAEEVTTRLDNLGVAREMEAAKKDAKAIKMATGWERGADGKWRYEIPDAKVKDTTDIGGGHIVKRFEEDMLWTDGKLGDVVDAPELFKAYPELKDIKLNTDAVMNDLPSNGEYNHGTKTITIHADELKYLNSILNHEIQHAIQHAEGFARGGNEASVEAEFKAAKAEWKARAYAHELEETAKELGGEYNQAEVEKALIKEYEDMGMQEYLPDNETRIKGFNYFARGYADRSMDDAIKRFRLETSTRGDFNAYNEYRKLSGEVEARNVQKRMGMTNEERRSSLASETEDVARENQIFLFGNGGESHMGSRTDKRMAEIGKHFEDKELSSEERAIVDVFSGKKDRQTVTFADIDGNEHKMLFVQGNEMKAGTKHAVYRHYNTNEGMFDAGEIKKVHETLSLGERSEKDGKIEYVYTDKNNGVEYTVAAAKKGGKERFVSFYTNRKASNSGMQNTQLSAQASLSDASDAAKVGRKSETDSRSDGNVADEGMKFRLLEDDDPKAMELESLPDSELVPVYRNVQAFEDDALGSPMAFTDAETGELRTLQGQKWNYSNPPQIELTPEQQRQLDELNKNGYIVVGGKKTTELQINDGLKFVKPKTKDAQLQYFLKKNPEDKGLWAAYDPYDHAIETPLNTQFSEAYKRPNLVVVRSLIPKSEIDEPYQADYALLPTGAHQWNNGRTLYLSRWSKIDKVLTREEEAKLIDGYWKKHPGKREALKSHRDYNRFVPQVRRELEKMGYRFELDGKELTPEESRALDEQNWESRDVIPGREGHTPFISNEDIARINAKMSGKWVGEPKEAMNDAMAARVNELAERLHTPVRIIRTDEDVAALPSARQRRMKGSFNPLTGEVTIVVPNNANMADVENTFLHEVVGHDGLRVLFPEEEKLNNALDELYRVSNDSIQQTIDRMAQKMYDAEVDRLREKKRREHEVKGEDSNASYYADMAEAHVEANKKREQFRRGATEEYGADLAGRIGEEGFEKMSAEEQTFWSKLKSMLQKALQRLLDGLKIPGKRKWSDKDWAFVLHEAYKRKKNGGNPTVFDAADTEVMRRKTGFGENIGTMGTSGSRGETGEKLDRVNERFNEQLTKFTVDNADKINFNLGNPSAKLLSAGVADKPIRLHGSKVVKKMKKHGFSIEELRDLPKAVANPIAVFDNLGKDGNRSVLTELKTANGNFLVTIDLGKGTEADFDIVSSVFGKKGHSVATWINKGYMRYVDKKKALNYLHLSAPIAEASDNAELSSAAKVVENFENPTTYDEKVADEGIMFRDGDSEEYTKAMARDTYERRVARGMYQTQEALQDSMLGLKEAMDAILEAEGNGKTYIENVAGYENAYLGENRLSSVNQAECAEFARQLFKPMLEEVARLAKSADERAELTDYMMAKHGLERNEVMARRAAAKEADEEFGADIRKAERAVNKNPLDQDAADRLDELRQQRDDREEDLYLENRGKDYSGLTALTGTDNVVDAEDEARRMVAGYENAHQTDELWDRVNAVTGATLLKTYESGLINKAVYDDIKGMYEHYIPLRGFDDKTSDEAYAYLADKHSAFNAPIKTAKGRKSKADDPFANMEAMAESAIMQGNRNTLVKQKFLNFALNHPSDLVSVSDLWLRYDDVRGEWMPVNTGDIAGTEALDEEDSAADVERKMRDFEDAMKKAAKSDPAHFKKQKDNPAIPYRVVESRDLRQHQVLVKRNGKDYLLTINGNPRAAQALNGQTNPDNDVSGAIGAILYLGETVNRHLSAFYTTRNPDFVVSNFMRDMLYSNTMVWVKESPNYAWRYNRNVAMVNPAKMKRLLARMRDGELDMTDATDKLFHQFIMNGGETGYANIRDIEQRKNDIKREVKKMGGKLPIRKAWSLLGERLDEYNRAVELCARFAAFKTSRELGRTIDRSIYDAKDISVNFNKKGSGAKFMDAEGQTKAGNAAAFASGLGRSLYVFWNAGIQGTTNFGRQAKRHPKKALAGVAAMFVLGMLMPKLGGADGDDDDRNDYYNLPEYVRRSNIVFRLPGMDKSWIALPLPVEYRAMYGMGELAMSAMSGREHYTGGELAHAMASQVSQMMPLDLLEGGGGFKPFVPSAAKPFAEVKTNESWTGMPIYKKNDYNKDAPEWTKAYKSANPYLVGVSKWLNEKTGGDRYAKGTIDINPAKVEYLLNGYFGGMSRSIDELVKMAETATGRMEYDPKNMMFVNRLVKRGDERTEYRAVNNEYWRIREECETLRKRLNHYERDTADGVFDYAEKIAWLNNSPEYRVLMVYEQYAPDIRVMSEMMKEAERNKDDLYMKKLETDMNQVKACLVHDVEKVREGKPAKK